MNARLLPDTVIFLTGHIMPISGGAELGERALRSAACPQSN